MSWETEPTLRLWWYWYPLMARRAVAYCRRCKVWRRTIAHGVCATCRRLGYGRRSGLSPAAPFLGQRTLPG